MTLNNPLKTLNFILIDDDVIQLFLIKKTLNDNFDFSEVVSFSMPEAAIEYIYSLKEVDFNDLIILLDLNMPAMTGWEVLDHLKLKYGPQLPENAKVFILSSSDLPEDICKSEDYPMLSGFYSKPLDKLKIEEIVENSFSRK